MTDTQLSETSGSILIIDDDETVREIAERYVQRLGFAAVIAADGPAGLRLAADLPQIAAVLLDLAMPHMPGAEVVRRLRELSPGIPILVMSGYDEDDVERHLAGWEKIGFMQKPFRLGDLRARLAALLAPDGAGAREGG